LRSYLSPLAMITPYFDASQMNCVFAFDLFSHSGACRLQVKQLRRVDYPE